MKRKTESREKIFIMLLARNYFGKITLDLFFMHLFLFKKWSLQIVLISSHKINYEVQAREAVSLPMGLVTLSPNAR